MEIKKVKLLNQLNEDESLSIGSGVVIIQDEKVLLVRGKGGSNFKFPGGHINDSENLKESAIREAFEEIGCKVNITSDPIFYLFKPDEILNIVLVHYLAEIIEGVPLPNTEIEEIKWFNIRDIPDNVFNNVNKVLKDIANNQ